MDYIVPTPVPIRPALAVAGIGLAAAEVAAYVVFAVAHDPLALPQPKPRRAGTFPGSAFMTNMVLYRSTLICPSYYT